jgi:signal transduction histidine kinase
MVNNYLDLTRLETKRFSLERQKINLRLLVEEVMSQCQAQALEKNLTLSLKVVDRVPQIPGNKKRLRQVMLVLIDNAIKYNRTGGSVELELSGNQVRVQVSVRDTGVGIATSDLELIFNKFYRVKNEAQASGAGLGLALARRIIQAHGGDIWVESQVGAGSRFTFSLPLD